MPAMRDVFWNTVFRRAREDRNIVVLAADFGAPALDRFRLELPGQFLHLGISEQNMLLLAAGMALEGKRPFCYAIAPFLTLRCFEQTKLYASGMNLPVTLAGVGAGMGYADSGYTHHAVEDIAVMRTLPHMRVFQPCDNASVARMAELACESSSPIYVRLDRLGVDNALGEALSVETGLSEARPVSPVTLLSSGNMTLSALAAADLLAAEGVSVGVVDLCSIPADRSRFAALLGAAETLITLEEHTLPGGLGSYVLETVSDLGLSVRVRRLGLDLSAGYPVEYGGRDLLQRQYGLAPEQLAACVKEVLA